MTEDANRIDVLVFVKSVLIHREKKLREHIGEVLERFRSHLEKAARHSSNQQARRAVIDAAPYRNKEKPDGLLAGRELKR